MFFLSISLSANSNPYSEYVSEEDYEYFWSLVIEYFRNEKIVISEFPEDGSVEVLEVPEDNNNADHPLYYFAKSRFYMDNLIFMCLQYEKAAWVEIVNGHFGRIKDSVIFEREINEKINDFQVAKEYLKVRLYPLSYELYLKTAIYESFVPETFSAVVFDYPFAVKIADKMHLDSWGLTEKEVFDIALDNTLKSIELKIEEFPIQGGHIINGVFGETVFTATDIYTLHNSDEHMGTYGTIYAIPNNTGFVFYPIEDNEAMVSVSVQLVFMAGQMYNSGVGSISPELYWLYDGQFYLIEQNQEVGTINFPDRYKELLKGEYNISGNKYTNLHKPK